MSADQAESSSKSLALTPPEPVAVVQAQQADELVPLSGEDVARLDAQVGEFVGEVLSLDVDPATAVAWQEVCQILDE